MKKQKKFFKIRRTFYRLSLAMVTLSLLLGSSALYAAIKNPLTVNDFPSLIEQILKNIVIPIGAVIAALAIVYAGFLFVTAQGSAEKISKARSAFIWAVIGGLILIGAWAISVGIRATMAPIIAGS